VRKMIKNYRDHAANERTFLAWVRTAIAVMAFGFLVERFDLFIEMAAPSLPGRAISHLGQKFGNVAGLALIVAGTVMVALSMVRFIKIEKSIDSEDVRADAGAKLDIALALLLILLGVSMFLYLSHAFVYA
jgi:putative membrane protein